MFLRGTTFKNKVFGSADDVQKQGVRIPNDARLGCPRTPERLLDGYECLARIVGLPAACTGLDAKGPQVVGVRLRSLA